MRENCTYGSMRGRAFPTGRPALLYTLAPPHQSMSSRHTGRTRVPRGRLEGGLPYGGRSLRDRQWTALEQSLSVTE